VEGNAGDPGAKFTFTVNLLVEPEITITSIFRPFGNNGDNGAVYAYVGFGGVPDGTISSGGKVELAHGQWIVIKGLPLDSTYEVIEDDADLRIRMATSLEVWVRPAGLPWKISVNMPAS